MSISSISASSINSLLSMDSASWAKKRFESLDTDSSGGLNADEFGKVADRIGVSTDDIFAEYDANKDGSLDKTEEANVFAAYAPQNQGSVDSKDALQSLMDKAFQSIMSMMDARKPPSDEDRFAKLDVNGDGGVDKDEFATVAEKTGLNADDVFAQYDTDNDGKLNATEEAASAEGFRAQHAQAGGQNSGIQSLLDALNSENDDESDSYQELLTNLFQKAAESYTNSGSSGTLQANQTVNVFNMTA